VDLSTLRRGSKKGEHRPDKEKPLSVGPWSFGKEEMKAAKEAAGFGSRGIGTGANPSTRTLNSIVSQPSSEASSPASTPTQSFSAPLAPSAPLIQISQAGRSVKVKQGEKPSQDIGITTQTSSSITTVSDVPVSVPPTKSPNATDTPNLDAPARTESFVDYV